MRVFYRYLFWDTLYYSVLFCIILYYSVLFCIILYYSVLFCIILYYSVLFCIILYYSDIFEGNLKSYGFLHLIYKTRAADFDGLKIWLIGFCEMSKMQNVKYLDFASAFQKGLNFAKHFGNSRF